MLEQPAVDTILTLPRHTGAYAIASACREALVSFLNESQHWGKAELAMWLMGPYAQVCAFGAGSTRQGHAERVVPLLREIDARMVQRVIRTAREEVFAALVRLEDPDGAAGFTLGMLSSGFIARCEDATSVLGWVPTMGARRLADRVLSLLAADFMTRPEHYENLEVCAQCRSVDFDGECHRHASGLFMPKRAGGASIPYLPEGA